MKLALLSIFLALPLCAQQVSVDAVTAAKALYRLPVHPKASFRAIKQHPYALLGSSLTLGLANGIDYATTELGPGQHPAQYCEQIVTTGNPCQLDQRKFDWLKASIAIFDAAQWIPVWLAPDWKYQQTYQATMVLVDGALTIPMMKADIGNVSALHKGGTLP